jgi:hypothetical protein
MWLGAPAVHGTANPGAASTDFDRALRQIRVDDGVTRETGWLASEEPVGRGLLGERTGRPMAVLEGKTCVVTGATPGIGLVMGPTHSPTISRRPSSPVASFPIPAA